MKIPNTKEIECSDSMYSSGLH